MNLLPQLQAQLSGFRLQIASGALGEEEQATQEALESCIESHDLNSCETLPTWMKGLKIPLSYLLTHSLYNAKMPIDEKKVLKNINEYLVRDGVSQGATHINGDISSIVIGDPKLVDGSNPYFYQVPIDYTIEFENIRDLVDFVYNVEKKLISIPGDRILYKIQEIGYDILSADTIQSTHISMLAYYYYNPDLPEETSQSFSALEEVVKDEDVLTLPALLGTGLTASGVALSGSATSSSLARSGQTSAET